ncbi:kinase-like domain-containing protein [Sphaerosporella brunnea]|uniref:Kinase-like domain-containing protein n=1 Tax=Sphaerosporella brunnea TaxID=1250544 RepID=A0A5J5F5V7_9PEZI|nr:kinase-like domain-containing protein [Sphaerosporella brunnea]
MAITVTEPLGPSIYHVLDELIDQPFPVAVARRVAAQVAKGLSYIHSRGVVHGDLHLGNILFRIPNLDLWTPEQVFSYLGEPEKVEIKRHDGQPLTSTTPVYAVHAPLVYKLEPLFLTEDCAIRICDFGEAFHPPAPEKRLHIPVWYAAPEISFQDTAGRWSDIWALACVFYRIFGITELFPSYHGRSDEVLMYAVRALGKLPERWWRGWEKRSIYFAEDGTFQPTDDERWKNYKEKTEDLKSRMGEDLVGLGAGEMVEFEAVLRRMLRFEPEERIEAGEVLRLLPKAWAA